MFEMMYRKKIVIWFWFIKFYIWEYKGRNGLEKNCDVVDVFFGIFLFRLFDNYVRDVVCVWFFLLVGDVERMKYGFYIIEGFWLNRKEI